MIKYHHGTMGNSNKKVVIQSTTYLTEKIYPLMRHRIFIGCRFYAYYGFI